MTTQDQSRAEFEAAWMKKPGVTKPPARFPNGGDYVYPAANTAWWAWQAARALPTHQEAKGFLHTLDNTEGIAGNLPHEVITSSPNHPFGTPGVDFSAEFPVMTRPLYEAPQEIHAGRVPLTDEQIEQATGTKRGEPLFLVAKGFTVAIEAAHGITHPTGD